MRRIRVPLQFKALAFLLTTVAGAVAAVAWFDLERSKQALHASVEHSATVLASAISTACELPLAVGDHDEINRLLDRYATLETDIAFIEITNPEGRAVAGKVVSPSLHSSYNSFAPTAGMVVHTADVQMISGLGLDPVEESSDAEARSAGTVVVGMSLAGLEAASADQRKAAINTAAVALCLSSIIVVLVVGAWTRRLQSLADSSRKITSGDLTHPINDRQPDEIGILATALDDMRRAIQLRDEQGREYTRELEILREEAEQASLAKSQFLAHMSHEIRTPLNGVVGMLDLLKLTTLDDRQTRFVDISQSSADALLSVINDILDFSKIEAGSLNVERADFDLYDTIESCVEMIAPKGQVKGLEIACRVAPDVPRHV